MAPITEVQTSSFVQIMDLGLKSLLFEKFKDIMSLTILDNDCVLYPKDVAQRVVAERRGEGTVEFINLWRSVTQFAWDRQRSPTAQKGFNMEYEYVANKKDLITIYAVPADLNYDVWFWSKDLDILQRVAERYLFWVHRNPRLNIKLQNRYPLEIYMTFGALVDESTVSTQFETGQYFVLRAPIKLDGWVFELPTNIKTILKIHVAIFDDLGEVPVLLTDWWIYPTT